MNGIHDLGGMHGFGPIDIDPDQPLFRHDWERRTFALFFGCAPHGFFNLDEFRHAIERMGAAEYLESPYYEHWLHAYETLLVENGAITAEEYATRCAEVAEELG